MPIPPLPPHEVVCTAEAVYYEARGASKTTKELVAELVWNRARDLRKSSCYVTQQKGQFPWSKYKPAIKEYKLWSESLDIARTVRPKITRVRYMVNTWAHTPQPNIHVLVRRDGLIFSNRYKDYYFKGECDYQDGHKYISPLCKSHRHSD